VQTWLRYAAFQIPGWVMVAVVLFSCVEFLGLAPRTAGIAFALWLAKDAALYPLTRKGYEHRPHVPAEHLIGARAIAQQELAPEGYVRVGAELWRARLRDRGARAPAGSVLVVRGVRQLELEVEPESASGSEGGR
jgi:membrane protein implicated in regulation of membrane protease activity